MLNFIFCLFCSFLFIKRQGEFFFILFFLVFIFLFSFNHFNSLFFVDMFFELDVYRYVLVLLRLWIILLCLIRGLSSSVFILGKKSFIFLNIIMLWFLVIRFRVSSFFLFYIRFECVLIPIFLLILGWGGQPERNEAGFYIFFYTLAGSLPLFFCILYQFLKFGRSYIYISWTSMSFFSFVYFFLILRAFLIKFPMYGVHLWLLKAHVEASVSSSIILAGVLLKLGGYGIIRFLYLLNSANEELFIFFIVFRLLGGVYISLSCLRQLDIKLLVASSSVVHIRICICCLLVFNFFGFLGVLIIITAHGLCSSGLFYLVNLVYTRNQSRSLLVNKGLLRFIPSLTIWWFLFVSCNISAPPRINLLGELFLIIRIVSWRKLRFFLIILLSFLRSCYRIYLFSSRQHGLRRFKNSFNNGKIFEYLILLLHWAPINFIILFMYFFF